MEVVRFIIATFFLTLVCNLESVSREEKEQNRIINQHGKLMHQQYGLNLTGIGGSIPNKIENFYLYYDINKIVSIDEARDYIVNAAQELLKMINRDICIRKYLYHYPMTIKDIKISIGFNPKQIYIALLSNGNVSYSVDGEKHAKQVKREIYEDALKIKNKEFNKIE